MKDEQIWAVRVTGLLMLSLLLLSGSYPSRALPIQGCGAPSISLETPTVSGSTVTVNGVYTPGSYCSISSLTWTWGDGKYTTSWFPASHSYEWSGTYVVTATVHQSDGQTASASVTAIVSIPLFVVTCSKSTMVVGSTVRCNARVHESGTKAPTGTIAWSSSGSGTFSQTSCNLSKHRVYSACSVKYIPTAAGSINITASYGGDANNPAAAGAYKLVVTKDPTRIAPVSCSPRSVIAGSPTVITCTATVKGYSPTGNVTWTQSGAGSVTFNSASCTLSQRTCLVTMTGTTAGKVTLQATYNGDLNNQVSTRTAKLTIKP